MQTRTLDVAVRELRSQQDRLLQIKEHDAERYACGPPASPLLQGPSSVGCSALSTQNACQCMCQPEAPCRNAGHSKTLCKAGCRKAISAWPILCMRSARLTLARQEHCLQDVRHTHLASSRLQAFSGAHASCFCLAWSANQVLAGAPQAGCILAGQCAVDQPVACSTVIIKLVLKLGSIRAAQASQGQGSGKDGREEGLGPGLPGQLCLTGKRHYAAQGTPALPAAAGPRRLASQRNSSEPGCAECRPV